MQTSSDHTNDPSYHDGEHTRNTDPAELVQGPWEAADEGWNGKDARVEHQTELVVAQSRQCNLASEKLTSRSKDREYYRPEAKQVTTNGTE